MFRLGLHLTLLKLNLEYINVFGINFYENDLNSFDR